MMMLCDTEREGISVKYPCKPIMIATMNAEDSELKDVFLDRIGIALNADTEVVIFITTISNHIHIFSDCFIATTNCILLIIYMYLLI